MQKPEILNAILARRSIRKYLDKPVEQEKIDAMLECACAAPSAHNRRHWRFIVVRERASLNAIAEIHPYGKMLAHAPLAIAVCGSTEKDDKVYNPWWEQDCAAAMQNLLLAAEGLGLNSVWLGVCHAADGLPKKLDEFFGVPEGVRVMGMAAIGYASEAKGPHSGILPGAVRNERW